MTTTEKRAADLRRAAAERIGEQRGRGAYDLARRTAPHPKQMRRPAMTLELRAALETDGARKILHTSGYFTRYELAYPMWDDAGKYDEMTMRFSGKLTLASKPDLGFLINHKGVTMARTKTGTLKLTEDREGGFHEAFMNMERDDVRLLALAIDDGDIDQMSFAFMIPDGAGTWTDDFTTFQIHAYDLSGGDVSAVNRGANPFTDISANADEIIRDLAYLPEGARDEARRALGVDAIEARTAARERITMRSPMVDRSASDHVRMLQWRKANTAARYAALGAATGMSVLELMNVALPWYEVVASAEADTGDLLAAPEDDSVQPVSDEVTDILIYDEIGGSFGTTADQFAADLAAITTPRINLRMNTPGGSVVDALAIANSIRHKIADGTIVDGFADGLVASAGTIIMIACSTVTNMPGAEWMTHFASSTIDGNKVEAAKMATFLDFQDRNIADLYAAKTGGTQADWLTKMADETWFTGEEAMNAGLVDRLWNSGSKTGGERASSDPRMIRRWDNLPYRFTSRAEAPAAQRRALDFSERTRMAAPTAPTLPTPPDICASCTHDMAKHNSAGCTLCDCAKTSNRAQNADASPAVPLPLDPCATCGHDMAKHDSAGCTMCSCATTPPTTGEVGNSGSTRSQPVGRSITLIQATLAADGEDITW